MRKFFLFLIRMYQKSGIFQTGLARALFLSSDCKFSPTCSQYTYDAIEKYGAFRGSLMGILRIIRCNPWSKGGHDPLK